MGRACSVCEHPDRLAIEAAAARGMGNRAISRQWRVSKDAIARHRDHLAERMAGTSAARALVVAQSVHDVVGEVHALDLARELRGLYDRVQGVMRVAQDYVKTPDGEGERFGPEAANVVLRSAGELRQLIALVADIQARAQEAGSVDVTKSLEWRQLLAAILDVLADQPETRARLAARLSEIVAGHGVV